MQLLTHIQLINVKIPGNAALFLNINNKLFRYDFFPNQWVADVFNLKLIPSPVPEFIQIRYLQVHMLMYTIFIFGCISLVILLMLAVPLIKRLSPKTAESLSKRLYWGVPIRLVFEFYFILALTSWNNMNNTETDVSVMVSYVVLVSLSVFTLYLVYTLMLACGVRGDTEREKNKQIQQLLFFVQRPFRLRRYKPQKFLQPVFFTSRRMVLAMVCVYMSHSYAY